MMNSLRGFLLVSTFLAALPAAAQSANPLADRENKVPPVVSWLQSQGVSLTYLGEEGGLRGYLGESANGKMQTFYVAPDGLHVIAGILFRNGGDNVTGVQIGEMRARFDAAAADLGSATVGTVPPEGQTTLAAPSEGAAAARDNASTSPAADEKPVSPAPAASSPDASSPAAPTPDVPGSGSLLPDELPAEKPAAKAGGQSAARSETVLLPAAEGPVAGAVGNPSELWISKIDKAEFLAAAEATPFFEVGTRNAPTTVWMVADPQCPFCHKAWEHLRAAVYGKQVKVRVILIAGLEGSEPLARDMLARPLPARAWLDSDAGRNLKRETDQSSPEWQKAGEFLEMNMEFARKFGVDRTPFLGYFAQDGQFYSALGLPSDLGSFFAASGLK